MHIFLVLLRVECAPALPLARSRVWLCNVGQLPSESLATKTQGFAQRIWWKKLACIVHVNSTFRWRGRLSRWRCRSQMMWQAPQKRVIGVRWRDNHSRWHGRYSRCRGWRSRLRSRRSIECCRRSRNEPSAQMMWQALQMTCRRPRRRASSARWQSRHSRWRGRQAL